MNSTMKKIVKSNEFFMFAIILVMFCIFGIINPAFFSVANLFDLSRSMVETGILALGVQVVMISGGIDLSFMAIAVFAMHTVSKYMGMYWNDAPFILLVLMGAVIGLVLGLFNSLFIAKFKLPPFIVTLGTTNIFKGLCLVFIGSRQINNIPASMIDFSKTNLISVQAEQGMANLHIGVLILVVLALLTSYMLNKTRLGRSIYCVGGSEASAQRVGLNTVAILAFCYAFLGAIAGMTGVMHASFQRMSNPFDMIGGELTVIAAVTIGGPRVGGGYGSPAGTMLSVLLLTMINNSRVMLQIPTFWQLAVTGMIIILGTIMQIYRYKRSLKNA